MKISTSILSAKDRIEAINKLNKTNTDYLHIDVMDGKFVPNYQMPINEILEYEKISEKKLDVHLMVDNPEEYISKLDNKNIEYITIHYEIDKDLDYLIDLIKNKGYKPCLSIKPNTSETLIYNYLDKIDMVLIMSVEPGLGGQEFMEDMIQKAINIKRIKPSITIEMDGGINNITINKIKECVDISVVGSYITKQDDYQEAINSLKN